MERHRMAEHTRYERLYGLFLAYAALLALFGLIMDTPVNILRGLSTIILTEDALITDYVLIAGPGAALVNSALVTAISTLILRRSGEPFNGFSPVAGMNLYNNGFSGGLVAIVLYPVIIAVVRHRKPTLVDQDYFDPLEHDEPVVPPVPHAITEEEDL